MKNYNFLIVNANETPRKYFLKVTANAEEALLLDAVASEVTFAEVRQALSERPTQEHVESALFPAGGLYRIRIETEGGPHTEARTTHSRFDSDTRVFARLLRILRFRVCDRCGRWLSPTGLDQASTWDRQRQERVCNECRENSREIRVCGYHGDGSTVAGAESTRGDNGSTYSLLAAEGETEETKKLTVGFELEASNPRRSLTGGNGTFEATPEYYRIRSHFKHERDGSLSSGGVEFVSQVLTLKYFRENRDVEAVCDQARTLGADDRDPRSGLHVHVSKAFLGDTPEEQAETACKAEAFLLKYQSDCLALCGRDPAQMGYCRFSTSVDVDRLFERVKAAKEAGEDPFGRLLDLGNSHSRAINFRGKGPTVEMRIFKSTTDPVAVRDAVEFTVALFQGLRKTPFKKIYALGKVLRYVPEGTLARLRSKGIFCRTQAAGEVRGRAF